MSADPQRSASLSRAATAEPAAAAASAPAAGCKRRASGDAAPNAAEQPHPSGSPMDDAPSDLVCPASTPSSMALAAVQLFADAAASAHSASAAATRKKQRLAPSAAAVHAVIVPPWSDLFSDALESIFEFATLQDLARLMSVSRRWGEAVMTTPLVAAPAFIRSAAQLHGLLCSRVRRHATALLQRGGSKGELFRLSAVQLQRASVQAPWLRDLTPTFLTTDGRLVCEVLPRFTNLRCLDIVLHPDTPAASCNRIIETIGGLNPATMKTLKMYLWRHSAEMSFRPLAALTQLRVFKFGFRHSASSPLTDAQICDLRALASLQQLLTPYRTADEADYLARMLQPGHALQWTSLRPIRACIEIKEPLAAVLGSLSTLTSLNACMRCADVEFLARLIRLTDVELDTCGPHAQVDPAALVSSLRHCTQITRLALRTHELTGRHLEELLPAFPLLSCLALTALGQLDSLRCFATPALAASLTSLVLTWLRRCPPSELSRLLGLRSLRDIRMETMATPLTAADVSAFCIPSLHFPALRESVLPEESEEE